MLLFFKVDVCTSAAPGQKECDSAVRSIQSVRTLLQHPSEPVNDLGYFQCVDTIIDQSKTLGTFIFDMYITSFYSFCIINLIYIF